LANIENIIFESQIALWRESIKPNLDQALELTPEDKLDWAPAEGMITIGNIFLHISECSDWWYDEVVNGKKAIDLSPSATAKCPPKAEIVKYMQIHWERMERLFAAVPDFIGQTFEVKGKEKIHHFTGAWIYTHLLEHDLHHRSQIHQYLRLLGIKPPSI